MKISEMIENLQEFMEEHGNIDCYYATDDEGNDYHEVYYSPTFYYVNTYGDVFNPTEIDEDEKEDLTPICVVN